MSTKIASKETSKGIIAWFVHNPVAANFLMILILAAGVGSLLNVRIEGFPSIPPNNITINVDYASGSASVAEEGITVKIEEALQGIEGIKRIESSSMGDSVSVTVTKTSGYNLDTLYQDVKAKVDAINTLPKRAERPVVSREVELEGVMTVNLFGDATDRVLQRYAEELRRKLLRDSQIQRVDYIGQKTPEIVIEVDEAQLQAQHLSISQIADKIKAASVSDTGGELLGPNGQITLNIDQKRDVAKAFMTIPVKETINGQQTRLADIATIKDDFANDHYLTRYNKRNTIGLEVKSYGKSNITHVAQSVRDIVHDYQETLPTAVNVELWNDRSKPIEDRLSLLVNNSALGIVLVVVLLALFLDIKVAFWVGAGLPVIFAGAMALMGDNLFGLTLNELTTFGFIMALGIVVDDAIVIGESIHDEQERHGFSVQSTILGAKKVATPTTYGVLTTMVAFLSMSLIEGELGKIFAQFSYAAAFCLLFSLIECKLILPSHLNRSRDLSRDRQNSIRRGWNGLQCFVSKNLKHFTYHVYEPSLRVVIRYRYAAFALFLSVFIVVLGMLSSGKVKSMFFPEISADFLTVELVFEEDVGYGLIQKETLMVERLSDELNQQLMEEFGLTIAPIQQLLSMTSENGVIMTVGLSANNQRPFTASDIALRWESMMPVVEGIDRMIFAADMIVDKEISIELRSHDNETIDEAGKVVSEALQKIAGVSAIQSALKAEKVQIDLVLKPQGRALGLSTVELLNQIQLAYQGYELQRIQQGENDVKVKIQYPQQKRQRIDDLQYARIRLSDGKVVALSAVADISFKHVATSIERIDRNRVNLISADVNKSITSPADILQQLDKNVFTQLKLTYPDLMIILSGQQQSEAEVTKSFKGAFMVAVIAIYALLAIPLKSYSQPIIIMCAIPFGIVGALLGHWLHDMPVSLLSLFGVLALSGVVVNDCLLLMSCYIRERNKGETSTEALILSGTGRIRAILLTSTTTYIGLVPLLTETSPQAQFLIPAAISMGYGILFSTAITLFLIPAIIMISEDVTGFVSRKQNKTIVNAEVN